MAMERDPAIFAMLKDPFLLGGAPVGGPRDEDADVRCAAPLLESAHLSPWTTVFMMAELNTRTVRRSNALTKEYGGNSYGTEFGYRERLLVGSAAEAEKMARPSPPVSKREEMRDAGRLPRQGEGPSVEQRAKSSFRFFFVGEAESSGRKLVTSIRCHY